MSSQLNTVIQNGPGFTPQPAFVRDVFSSEVWLAAMPTLKFDQFTTRKTELGTVRGKTIVMNKLGNVKRGGTLQEGVRVQARSMNSSSTSISVDEKGNAIAFTEALLQQSFYDVMSAASILLGRDMAIVLDLDIRNAIMTSPNVVYANGRTARTQLLLGDTLDSRSIRDAVEILEANNAPRWGGDHYVMFIHPHQARGLREDDDWVNAHLYGGQTALYQGEIGMWESVRFVVTSVMPNGARATKDVNGEYIDIGYDPALASGFAGNQTIIYKAVMFGEAAVAHATGLPVELRDNGVEDYGREHGIMWYAIWGQGLYEQGNAVVVETALQVTQKGD